MVTYIQWIILTVDFYKDIARITVSVLLSKTGAKIDKGVFSGLLSNNLSKALECISIDLFNAKLHAHSLDSQVQRIGSR